MYIMPTKLHGATEQHVEQQVKEGPVVVTYSGVLAGTSAPVKHKEELQLEMVQLTSSHGVKGTQEVEEDDDFIVGVLDDGDAIEEENIPDASVNYPASNNEVVSSEEERMIK